METFQTNERFTDMIPGVNIISGKASNIRVLQAPMELGGWGSSEPSPPSGQP